MKSSRNPDSGPCPCGSGKTYPTCCGAYHQGTRLPQSAEQLMRSRYTAYALGNQAWLQETWHPATRGADLDIGAPVKWFRLQILDTERGGPDDDEGIVEFVAHYKVSGRAQKLRERSRFKRLDGRWYYVGG